MERLERVGWMVLSFIFGIFCFRSAYYLDAFTRVSDMWLNLADFIMFLFLPMGFGVGGAFCLYKALIEKDKHAVEKPEEEEK
jgi:hypothetical protein